MHTADAIEDGLKFLFFRWTKKQQLKKAVSEHFNLLYAGWEVAHFYSPDKSIIYWVFYETYHPTLINEVHSKIIKLAADAIEVGNGQVEINPTHITIPLSTLKIALAKQEYVR